MTGGLVLRVQPAATTTTGHCRQPRRLTAHTVYQRYNPTHGTAAVHERKRGTGRCTTLDDQLRNRLIGFVPKTRRGTGV